MRQKKLIYNQKHSFQDGRLFCLLVSFSEQLLFVFNFSSKLPCKKQLKRF